MDSQRELKKLLHHWKQSKTVLPWEMKDRSLISVGVNKIRLIMRKHLGVT